MRRSRSLGKRVSFPDPLGPPAVIHLWVATHSLRTNDVEHTHFIKGASLNCAGGPFRTGLRKSHDFSSVVLRPEYVFSHPPTSTLRDGSKTVKWSFSHSALIKRSAVMQALIQPRPLCFHSQVQRISWFQRAERSTVHILKIRRMLRQT